MKSLLPNIILFHLLATLPIHAKDVTPPLPKLSEVFTVNVLKYSGTTLNPEFQFDKKSFMEAYPHFIPTKVNIPLGVSFAWQNGVIVTKDKAVLFWRTCDKRFIMIDTPDGVLEYGISDKVSLSDR
jgi:hypothetical protein